MDKDLKKLQEKQLLVYARDLAKTFSDKKDTQNVLKLTNKQLMRSEKLAIIGQNLAAFSHEMKNSLTPIIANSELIPLMAPNLQEDVLQVVKKIQNRARATADLLNQFLDFSRDTGVHTKFDVIERLEKSVDFFNFRFRKSKVIIERKYHINQAKIEANAGQIDQVFSNLIVNALDAMNEKGTLTLDIDVKEDNKDLSQSCVEIRVSDNGTGIEKDIQEKIFEPFFTTKKEGKGTGLGLFIIHQIMEQHGGIIDVESVPGKGTTFIIKMRAAK